MLNRPQTPEVAAIGKINFSGNLIPESWYHEIKTEKRVSLSAVVILSEIVWWYRPREIRDEQSGKVIEYARKFKGETLQRSYASLANKFGLSKKQAADACKLLESLGLITLEVKKCVVLPSGDRLGNVMFIHINPERIAQITHPLIPQSNSPSLGGSYVSKSNSSDQNNEGLSPESNRVAPESNRVAPESNRLLPESETYTEITTETTSEISSEIKNQDPLYPPKGDGVKTGDKDFQNSEELERAANDSTSLSNGSPNTPKAKHKQKGASRRAAAVAKNFPEQFDQWWIEYRQFCIGVDKESGDRAAAVKTWDFLIEEKPNADIPGQVLEGTQWYAAVKFQEYRAKGAAIGVPHGGRFLSHEKWIEALEHKAAKPDYLAKAKSINSDADALWKQVFFAISGGDCELPPIAKQAIASFGSIRELGNQSPEWIERVLKPKFFKEIQNATP